MKERIVIKDEFWVKHFQEREKDFYEEDMCSGGNPEEWWHYKKEQVPETYEELKELCKDIKGIEFAGGNAKGEIIEISNIWFAENGEIWGYTDDFTGICNISKDRTPQQMWQIIKNLIGEE